MRLRGTREPAAGLQRSKFLTAYTETLRLSQRPVLHP